MPAGIIEMEISGKCFFRGLGRPRKLWEVPSGIRERSVGNIQGDLSVRFVGGSFGKLIPEERRR